MIRERVTCTAGAERRRLPAVVAGMLSAAGLWVVPGCGGTDGLPDEPANRAAGIRAMAEGRDPAELRRLLDLLCDEELGPFAWEALRRRTGSAPGGPFHAASRAEAESVWRRALGVPAAGRRADAAGPATGVGTSRPEGAAPAPAVGPGDSDGGQSPGGPRSDP